MENGLPQILVGLGGWEHEVLDECFYPQIGLEPLRKLAFYSGHFDFVEVRSTFWDESLTTRDAAEWIAVCGTVSAIASQGRRRGGAS